MIRGVQRTLFISTLRWAARTTTGLLLCTALAFAAGYLFSNHPANVFVPLLFVLVLVAIAARFGILVGILGSILSAAIFAHLLFSPVHSFTVASDSARAALAWMVLGGIAIPYLVLPGLRSNKNK